MAKIKDEIHENDIGTIFRVTIVEGVDNPVAVNLTGFTSIDFVFEKPTDPKTQITRTASIVDVVNGIISYTTVLDDLDTSGRWRFQIALVLPAWNGLSDIGEFLVHENL